MPCGPMVSLEERVSVGATNPLSDWSEGRQIIIAVRKFAAAVVRNFSALIYLIGLHTPDPSQVPLLHSLC